ncbi:MAG: ferredoxin [Clostridiaceae bacterium]
MIEIMPVVFILTSLIEAWAVIKIPMLATESKFLGIKFMSIRWVLTTISIFVMAFIMGKIIKDKDVMLENQDKESYVDNVNIKEKYCVGCGLCSNICPKHFKMNGKMSFQSNFII